MKIVFLYPPSPYLNHSMFKHFTYFSETIDIISRTYSDVHVVDCAVELKNRNDLYEEFYGVDFLITLVEPYNIKIAIELMEICKFISPSCKTITFGTASALIPNYLSKQKVIDYIIANGEFAPGILSILNKQDGHMSFIENRVVDVHVENGKHTWGCALNADVPIDKYKFWGRRMFEFTVQVGCPYNCSFCSEKILFKSSKYCKFEHRPVDEIIDILKHIKGQFTSVYFSATTFTFDRNWVLELCNRMIDDDCIVPWRTDTRANCLDREMIKTMKKAGLTQLSLGIESLEDRVLASVNKAQTSKSIIDTIKLCKENEVAIKALLILGIPGQTAQDVLSTQRIIEELGIPYRWKEYSPIKELYLMDKDNKDLSPVLEQFSRGTFKANSIPGLSTEDYMNLLFPRGYIR